VSKILIGNKCDLEDKRAVSIEDAQALAQEKGMEYLETSAAEEVNIDNAFRRMAKMILERTSKKPTHQVGDGLIKDLIQNGNANTKKKCCS